MKSLELAGTLPNGLHDSEVSELIVSYADPTIQLAVNVRVGGMESEASRESYRQGIITIHEFVYCVLGRPDVNYPYEMTRVLTIDVVEPDESAEYVNNFETAAIVKLEY